MSRSKVLQSTDPSNSIATATGEAVADLRIEPDSAGDPAGMRPEDLQMAHELCTPLTALKSAIELLRQSDLAQVDEHMVRIAQRNVDRMALIIEAMLSQRSIKS